MIQKFLVQKPPTCLFLNVECVGTSCFVCSFFEKKIEFSNIDVRALWCELCLWFLRTFYMEEFWNYLLVGTATGLVVTLKVYIWKDIARLDSTHSLLLHRESAIKTSWLKWNKIKFKSKFIFIQFIFTEIKFNSCNYHQESDKVLTLVCSEREWKCIKVFLYHCYFMSCIFWGKHKDRAASLDYSAHSSTKRDFLRNGKLHCSVHGFCFHSCLLLSNKEIQDEH